LGGEEAIPIWHEEVVFFLLLALFVSELFLFLFSIRVCQRLACRQAKNKILKKIKGERDRTEKHR
jgi:hypothetical protein